MKSKIEIDEKKTSSNLGIFQSFRIFKTICKLREILYKFDALYQMYCRNFYIGSPDIITRMICIYCQQLRLKHFVSYFDLKIL